MRYRTPTACQLRLTAQCEFCLFYHTLNNLSMGFAKLEPG